MCGICCVCVCVCGLCVSVQDLLKRVVTKTEGYEVCQLEKLYALLCQSIYRHRKKYDKTELVQVCVSGVELFILCTYRPIPCACCCVCVYRYRARLEDIC